MKSFILTILCLLTISSIAFADTATEWDKVVTAKSKGLPKTAIESLDRILKETKREHINGEWLKAFAEKTIQQALIEGGSPASRIIALKEELQTAPIENINILNAILAKWYWDYFEQNRWRFTKRTQIADSNQSSNDISSSKESANKAEDFTTWDLPRLFKEIDLLFSKALQEKKQLTDIPLSTISDFLEAGTMPDNLRPSLYDFIAHEALNFYQTAEQAGASHEDDFQILSDSKAFGTLDEFLTYTPETTDVNSSKLKAISLYKTLLNEHLKKNNIDAIVDLELSRLLFVKNNAVGEEKNKKYISQLETLLRKYPHSELASLVNYRIAEAWGEEGDLLKAHQLAERCEAMQPTTSIGSQSCAAYRNKLETKSLSIGIERSIPTTLTSGKAAKLHVTYNNLSQLYFRIVKDDWKRFMSKKWGSPDSIDDNEVNEALGNAALETWSMQLEPTTDFQPKTTDLDLPQLAPGYYRIFASWQADFSSSIMFQHADFWVCDYTLVTRSIHAGKIEGIVLNANSGEPISEASVKLISRDASSNHEYYNFNAETTTERNGLFALENTQNSYDQHIYIKYKNQELFDSNSTSSAYMQGQITSRQTLFFTDRSIYRPGQTIQFKGILVQIDQAKNNYETIPKENLSVIFRDTNGQEISRQDVRSNDFGSFSGSFTAPSDRLMGQMSLISTRSGMASIRVEEYKRPKFFVKLETPKESYRLDDEVIVSGKAENYNGAAVDGADVSFQVQREVRYPWWCYYCSYRYSTNLYSTNTGGSGRSQEIAHGKVKTEQDGTFKIVFNAKPDLKAEIESDPSFSFKISADITATDGETRSDQTIITLGYSALALKIETPELITANQSFELQLNSQTLDGSSIPTEKGLIKIFSVKQPESPIPAPLWNNNYTAINNSSQKHKSNDEIDSDWRSWQNAAVYATYNLDTHTANPQKISLQLPEGIYRIEASSKDRFGKEVTSSLPIMVTPKWQSQNLALKLTSVVKLKNSSVPVGSDMQLFWGTGYKAGQALIEIEHKGETIKRYWTEKGITAHSLNFHVGEELRGGFGVRVSQVKENRAYLTNYSINVPWDNKQLSITTETFRDKLRPGEKETWKFKIKGHNQELRAAEFAATLYDSSLDMFSPHTWSAFDFFANGIKYSNASFINREQNLLTISRGDWTNAHLQQFPEISYASFPRSITERIYYRDRGLVFGQAFGGEMRMEKNEAMADMAEDSAAPQMQKANYKSLPGAPAPKRDSAPQNQKDRNDSNSASNPDLSKIAIRKNLQETAFFYPHLQLEQDGSVSISFTVPEALTKWKFLGFAHSNKAENGTITSYTTTQKELMVQPNAPRFMREGDELWFSAKVINMSDTAQNGTVRLSLKDLISENPINEKLGLVDTDQQMTLGPKESKAFFWKLKLPLGTNPISYTVVAATNEFSDAEAGAVPVLSSRIYLTESLPLSIRGPKEKVFNFERIKDLQNSKTLDPQRLTLQIASNPSWYAIQALPYLIEYPYECSEQVFNRLYANSLASHIANSNPRIRQIFNSWKGTDALKSNLEKNQQLKSALLEETPWVVQAKSETQAKQNVGMLFDENNLQEALETNYSKLKSMQLSNGAWSWFPGGRPDSFITLYVVSGFGRLKHMGVAPKMEIPLNALNYLDNWIYERYSNIREKSDNNLDSTIALYLYTRSFFLQEKPLSTRNQVAVDYFRTQASEFWLSLNSRLSQGYVALAANRFGENALAREIAASLKERSVSSEEFGMYWRDTEDSWWWYRAPIETQALMIEVFNEITKDSEAVEDAKVWLLKQKQTQDWKTTKATADAIYALILTGQDLLGSNELVKAQLGDTQIKPTAVEPGTGFYEVAYYGKEINPSFSKLTLQKQDRGIAWGGLHFQYFEDISKVTSHSTTLSLEKQLFVKKDTKNGKVIEPVKGTLSVGDLVVARIILKTDRDMEYVHLKDARGSGLEPVNVLSQYKSQDGLYYYESTKDTASHFFINYLPKGTYVFEYDMRVQLKGHYQSGLAEIQCMYAPEFNSHSESVWIDVK